MPYFRGECNSLNQTVLVIMLYVTDSQSFPDFSSNMMVITVFPEWQRTKSIVLEKSHEICWDWNVWHHWNYNQRKGWSFNCFVQLYIFHVESNILLCLFVHFSCIFLLCKFFHIFLRVLYYSICYLLYKPLALALWKLWQFFIVTVFIRNLLKV